MAEKLTPQQHQAVMNRGGKLLVSAAAGSGKTKVLVDRLLSYLNDPGDPANLDDFLIITYTKAAAGELRAKIAAKLTEAIAADPDNRHLQRQMQRLFLTKISTVHGFCGDVLREFAYRLDLPADFRVADENECRELREMVLSELLDRAYESAAEDEDFCSFVDSQGLGRTDLLAGEIVLKVYDSARCHLNPGAWMQECLDATEVEGLTDAAQTVWGKFLLEDLHAYLEQQIAVMDRCAVLAEQSEGMEKPAANLRDTVYQMKQLQAAQSWDQVLAHKDIEFGRLTFPRKGIDGELAEQIKACRTACKKGLEKQLKIFSDESAAVLDDLVRSGSSARGLIHLVRQFDEAYGKIKRNRRVLDFSDLEHKMLDLLLGVKRNTPTGAAREIGSRFREIMVDEYQDSNGVQDAIFGALTDQRGNCFMVGDVKQSIYQFRLADPGIFLKKYHEYSPAEEVSSGAGRKVLLSANFRSGPEVIDAVNDVFGDCMCENVGGLTYGEAEMLREGIPHTQIPEPAVELHCIDVRESTYEEEPSVVAERISQLLDGTHMIRDREDFRPIREEDIVILLRSPGSVGGYFQKALEQKGIRCTSGGGTDLLQTEEIGTLWSILQIVANPQQDIPLISALASPVFGFTADDLAALRCEDKYCSIYDALRKDDSPKSVRFLDVLEELRLEARMNTISQLIERIFLLTRADSIYGAMTGGQLKVANLHAFYGLAAEFESASRRELGQFLEYLDLMKEKGLIGIGESSSGAVTIMSIHKSKGLEFPVVFLCGLGREFNRESLRAQVLCDRELGLGLSVADPVNRLRYPAISKRAIGAKTMAESLSEEMRVLYVAMTRARDRLIMTFAARNLQSKLQDTVLRMDMDNGRLQIQDAACPGEWVLLSALRRMEAGELHQIGGRPAHLRIAEHPWKITVAEAEEAAEHRTAVADQYAAVDDQTVKRLKESLTFVYPHAAATQAPSKQTATQQKGRMKDREAAEEAQEPKQIQRNWRQPSFRVPSAGGTAYGSAIHAVMQHIGYQYCVGEQEIRNQVKLLKQKKLITGEQADMVDCRTLAAFFDTEYGRMLRSGVPCIREFKFSILDDGSRYGEGLEGEQVLLQGVVDCAILEEDGITVIDFKTDYVTEEILQAVTERYQRQLRVYADALARIYRKPVKKACLYFFKLNRFIAI